MQLKDILDEETREELEAEEKKQRRANTKWGSKL